MATPENLKILASNIISDIEDFHESYSIEDDWGEDDLFNYLSKLENLKREHRRIHKQIKEKEGANFDSLYPNYEVMRQTLIEEFKTASERISSLRKSKNEKLEIEHQKKAKLELEKLEQEKVLADLQFEKLKFDMENNREIAKQDLLGKRGKCRCEFEIFIGKVKEEITESNWTTFLEVDELSFLVCKFENRLENLDKIYSDLSGIFSGEMGEFENDRNELFSDLKENIKGLKGRIRDIKADAALREAEKVRSEEIARDSQVMTCAEDLYSEIKARYDTLLGKCQINLSELGDYEILNVKKREDSFNVELRELIDKVTAYCQFVFPCREKVEAICQEIGLMRNLCIKKVGDLFRDVDKVISENDISEKKLKNAASLNIDLKKFKGYDSDVDIYTFREDFQKLVEPNIQKPLLPDFLKKNYLTGSAYALVAKFDKIEEIWEKLIDAFGNTQLLLQNKICSLEKFSTLEKLKDDGKIVFALSGLINVMNDLKKLAATYDLEGNLYYGGGLQRILKLIGENRKRKFLKVTAKDRLNDKAKWGRLEEFLENERTERENFVINEKTEQSLGLDFKPKGDKEKEKYKEKSDHDSKSRGPKDNFDLKSREYNKGYVLQNESGKKCHICDESENHVVSVDKGGQSQIQYFTCKKFVELNPFERMQTLYKKGLCAKCLKPGMKRDSEHACDMKFICRNTYKTKKGKVKNCLNHILVCGFHAGEQNNIELFREYKKDFILNGRVKFEPFSKEVSISFHADSGCPGKDRDGNSSAMEKSGKEENAIFMFQTVEIESEKFNIFYDSGCGDLCVKKTAVDRLIKLNRAKQVAKGPLFIAGVGDVKSVCEHGAYCITLPLENGGEATMSGLCLDRITGEFPKYPLKKVESDFYTKEVKIKRFSGKLPKLPKEVGGEVDIMIGIQYLKYHPREIATLETGLTLYRSSFKNSDSSRGVIAGPHSEFTKVDRSEHFIGKLVYVNPIVRTYDKWIESRNEIPLLWQKSEIYSCRGSDLGFLNNEIYLKKKVPKVVKIFEEIERAGTEITYRCLDCRECAQCKKGSAIEETSIQTDIEEQMIIKSVSVDFENHIASADLPFLSDPNVRLSPNIEIARKIYNGQVKKLANRELDRLSVIESENKLQNLGYVEYLDNLDESIRMSILKSELLHFIPWRVVWNGKSLSTLVRLVFDASSKTKSGFSLNDLLPKGANVINNLIQILIRWKTKKFAFHTDVTKMYNAIKLNEAFWHYQLYLWENDLNPTLEPYIKVIKTIIYGVVPSGNQAICALRKVAKNMAIEYPKASEVIEKDVYVDDCISGTDSSAEMYSLTDDLKVGLETGGFTLKGFTFSGILPDGKLSADGESIHVGGLKWFPKEDKIALSMDELNFTRKVRGRKDENAKGVIPNDLTKRDCVSKMAECFSPTGIVVPLISGMKLDCSVLHARGLDWDEQIPDDLKGVWESNFEMLSEMRNLRYNRAIVPIDAKSIDIETIGTGDASQKMICAAIYARFEKKDGSFSCQLIFARSKVISEGTSTPRAELMAAVLNATTGHVVAKALGDRHVGTVKLTDSQVALHWICSKRTVLKTWVRNRVIEINRLADSSLWRYVDGPNMIADIGTRKGIKVSDVTEDSTWMKGFSWMSERRENFPVFTVEQIKLDKGELEQLKKEQLGSEISGRLGIPISENSSTYVVKKLNPKVEARYTFSKYLIDPNRFRFRKVVRILSLVLTYIKRIGKNVRNIQESKIYTHSYPGELPKIFESNGDKYVLTTGMVRMGTFKCTGGKVLEVTNDMLKSSMYYFARKATLELKYFVDQNLYKNITKEIDNVLYYSGRIPPEYNFEGYPELCDAAIDLTRTTFCVPVMDRFSPVAFAISMEVHWYHPDVKHKGVESLLRQTETVVHIIGGRNLTKTIQSNCKMCRILNKKSLEAVMGPIQNVNLCIAPCFYACQVDIFGPHKSYSNVNKRASIKVWFLIFCCCTTGAADVRLMDDYSTDSFILAFIRFSCRFGYPRWVLPDEGSQLVKGCKDMEYSFVDVQQKLSIEHGVDFRPCPVGAHYVHGKVERKIRQIKKSLQINMKNERLSVIQWETLMQQISNSVNNLPIGVKNKVEKLENLDIITPNRLLLGRNNNRCPNAPLEISNDYKRIIETNANIFKAWFKAWLISYVPSLIERPKWHKSDPKVNIGDVILFLKSEQEYDIQYQYGIVSFVHENKDGQVRRAEIEYRNHNENIRRKTIRGIRDIIMIYPIDELDIYHELAEMMI